MARSRTPHLTPNEYVVAASLALHGALSVSAIEQLLEDAGMAVHKGKASMLLARMEKGGIIERMEHDLYTLQELTPEGRARFDQTRAFYANVARGRRP